MCRNLWYYRYLQMRILLAAATLGEIEPTIRQLEMTAKPGLSQAAVEVRLTGVGLVAATYWLDRHIRLAKPDLVIQAGIGGSFEEEKIGGVYAIQSDLLGDCGVYEFGSWKSLFDMGLVAADQPPYQLGALPNPHDSLLSLSGLEQLRAISVNEITTSPEKINIYRKQFDPAIESMEGAALHYVCLQENMPFLQVRAVSNRVGERDKRKWQMKKSIDVLNEIIIDLLSKISNHYEDQSWL